MGKLALVLQATQFRCAVSGVRIHRAIQANDSSKQKVHAGLPLFSETIMMSNMTTRRPSIDRMNGHLIIIQIIRVNGWYEMFRGIASRGCRKQFLT
jgi:hypothetical protein